MLELMMQEQASAKKEAVTTATIQSTKAGLGAGFKKGFLSSTTKQKSTADSSNATGTTSSVPGQREEEPIVVKANVTTKAAAPSVLSDLHSSVQAGLRDDPTSHSSSKLLQELEKGDWATPGLIAAMQSNDRLAQGLRSPKCMAAMELMMSDPAEAKRRFAHDTEVSLFLQEFGRVMSAHFESLAAANTRSPQTQTQTQSAHKTSSATSETAVMTKVSTTATTTSNSSLGPLHADIVNNKRT
jgi:hypothetical protein